jgi:hypothetical protein
MPEGNVVAGDVGGVSAGLVDVAAGDRRRHDIEADEVEMDFDVFGLARERCLQRCVDFRDEHQQTDRIRRAAHFGHPAAGLFVFGGRGGEPGRE